MWIYNPVQEMVPINDQIDRRASKISLHLSIGTLHEEIMHLAF
jgi:hypothetical protein